MVIKGLAMEDSSSRNEGFDEEMFHVFLTKEHRIISRTLCSRAHNLPREIPENWEISSFLGQDKMIPLRGLPRLILFPAGEDSYQQNEWGVFLNYLQRKKKVAIAKLEFYEFYILPPDEGSTFDKVAVLYKEIAPNVYFTSQRHGGLNTNAACGPMHPGFRAKRSCMPTSQSNPIEHSPDLTGKHSHGPGNSVGCGRPSERNYARAHPSYLRTLGQAHSSWPFGAIAEFVDNSRDAKATKLEISIGMVYSKHAGKEIPMLSIIDDGLGMSHQDVARMISFGHIQPEVHDRDRIGRFGIGFKTGAMRLGKDALVLTQTRNSRSIAFLSQSLNEGKDNLEIPIVSYHKIGQYMEVDISIQAEASAKYNLKIVKDFSPFDKYLIGEKAGRFSDNGTGTQIFIWNLDTWGSHYSLQWDVGMNGGSSFHQGDIVIRSKRIRSRPGQVSQKVPLDYSLRSYLEVIFLDPRMKIYVQGALVQSRPLAKSLNKTITEIGIVMRKPLQLTLGRSQLEWEQANCGIFLYWHGRLIEAYKRVGSMIHNGDNGRGIIGVVDVTELMDVDNGHVWVHNSKQGFQDCEAYAELEKWLGERVDEYIDEYVDPVQLRKGNAQYKPDHEWVQCNKCRKWRMLSSDFDSKTLPSEWFCYMKPFVGRCEVPEDEAKRGVITISASRHGHSSSVSSEELKHQPIKKAKVHSEGGGDDASSSSRADDDDVQIITSLNGKDDKEVEQPPKKHRPCRGRTCKKK